VSRNRRRFKDRADHSPPGKPGRERQHQVEDRFQHRAFSDKCSESIDCSRRLAIRAGLSLARNAGNFSIGALRLRLVDATGDRKVRYNDGKKIPNLSRARRNSHDHLPFGAATSGAAANRKEPPIIAPRKAPSFATSRNT